MKTKPLNFEVTEPTTAQEQIITMLNSFVGKTLERIDNSTCNKWTFYFTDGTKFVIETERMLPTYDLYGMTAYIPNEREEATTD